jgi:hypothetical protein
MPAKAGIHALPAGPKPRFRIVLSNKTAQAKLAKASASFLKKRSKKLLVTVGFVSVRANAPKDQKFFASFFQKSMPRARTGEALDLLYVSNTANCVT